MIAFNEADKIEAALRSVKWADEIVVIDSHSTDGTAEIAADLGARVVQVDFKGFGDLRRSMPGVTSKVLRQHLRQLHADGIIAKVIYEKPVRRVCYKLTPHGRTLGPVFETLWAWGTRHLALASSSQEANGRCSRQMLD